MVSYALFNHFLGIESKKQVVSLPIGLGPESKSYAFLEQGHVMEFLLIGKEKRKIVSLFFEPNDIVIPSHPVYSHLVSLDDCKMLPFNYSTIFRMLREFPGTKFHYQELKKMYEKKAESRIHSLKTMTAPERFAHLKATQPWVFSLVEEDDIASYLRISVGMLRSFHPGL
jgi:hypothetical protein